METPSAVELQKSPAYYERTLANGKPITDIAPTIEWGYLLYLTVFRLCQYFGAQEECQFCDINENYRQQKKAGRPYTSVKSVAEILEALEIIAETDSDSKAYTVTGGSITSTLEGKSEVDFYLHYPEAIEKRFPGRWISKVVVQALPKDEVQKLRDAGVQIYHPNYEIWDKKLFETLCAGKARYIGREEWIRRILDAATVFPPEHVIPNFVAGIEMAGPGAFESVDEAIASTRRPRFFHEPRHFAALHYLVSGTAQRPGGGSTGRAARCTMCVCSVCIGTPMQNTASLPRPGMASPGWERRFFRFPLLWMSCRHCHPGRRPCPSCLKSKRSPANCAPPSPASAWRRSFCRERPCAGRYQGILPLGFLTGRSAPFTAGQVPDRRDEAACFLADPPRNVGKAVVLGRHSETPQPYACHDLFRRRWRTAVFRPAAFRPHGCI